MCSLLKISWRIILKISYVCERAESKQTQYPVTITTYDASGNEVEQIFEKAPERIVTNNLSATETLIELGLGDKIVGIMNPDNEVTSIYKDSVPPRRAFIHAHANEAEIDA